LVGSRLFTKLVHPEGGHRRLTTLPAHPTTVDQVNVPRLPLQAQSAREERPGFPFAVPGLAHAAVLKAGPLSRRGCGVVRRQHGQPGYEALQVLRARLSEHAFEHAVAVLTLRT